MEHTRLFIRFDFTEGVRLGPGKIALLEAVGRLGSIAAAARELGMGYRTAWLLIDSLNSMFRESVVSTVPGRKGGASEVTPFGNELIATFRRMEQKSRKAVQSDIATLRRKLK